VTIRHLDVPQRLDDPFHIRVEPDDTDDRWHDVPPRGGFPSISQKQQGKCHASLSAQALHFPRDHGAHGHAQGTRDARASRQRKRGRARNSAAHVREQSAGLAQFRDTRSVRTIVAVVALVLGAYCLIAAATALWPTA
jgi:hypothetical protein